MKKIIVPIHPRSRESIRAESTNSVSPFPGGPTGPICLPRASRALSVALKDLAEPINPLEACKGHSNLPWKAPGRWLAWMRPRKSGHRGCHGEWSTPVALSRTRGQTDRQGGASSPHRLSLGSRHWSSGLARDRDAASLQPQGAPKAQLGWEEGDRARDTGWQHVRALPRGPRARPHWGYLGWSRSQGAVWGCPSSCQSISCSLSGGGGKQKK